MTTSVDALPLVTTTNNNFPQNIRKPDEEKQSDPLLPTNSNQFFYNMNHPRRGIAIVFSQSFECHPDKLRKSAKSDCTLIESTMKNLGFEVDICENYTYWDIIKKIKEIQEKDHSDCDCFAMFVLTHGDQNSLEAADEKSLFIKDLWSPFAADLCPTLAGKPKLFFIQACRGSKADDGHSMKTNVDGDGNEESNVDNSKSLESEKQVIPCFADILIYQSSPLGYVSFTYEKGSWLIMELCKELQKNAERLDLLTMLTRVSYCVAYDYKSNDPTKPHYHQKKQIPCLTSKLTKQLFFKEPPTIESSNSSVSDELLPNETENQCPTLLNWICHQLKTFLNCSKQ